MLKLPPSERRWMDWRSKGPGGRGPRTSAGFHWGCEWGNNCCRFECTAYVTQMNCIGVLEISIYVTCGKVMYLRVCHSLLLALQLLILIKMLRYDKHREVPLV